MDEEIEVAEGAEIVGMCSVYRNPDGSTVVVCDSAEAEAVLRTREAPASAPAGEGEPHPLANVPGLILPARRRAH